MKEKRFFKVLIAASALALFSSFSFGQDRQFLPGLFPWEDAVKSVCFQVDEIAVQADSLQGVVETEVADKDCCDEKRALYKESLASIQEAWSHITTA